MNIEHTKDDFAQMLPTLVHETFHRLQATTACANPEVEEVGFDRITSYAFESPKDRRLEGRRKSRSAAPGEHS
jgi:hypothetical protein